MWKVFTDLTQAQTINILSAMITPVVLILASGSILLTTSQRLGRSVDRARKLSDKMREMMHNYKEDGTTEVEVILLSDQLKITAKRSRLLQQSMTLLYVTVCFFLATCISIAIELLFRGFLPWLPFALGIIGVLLLFAASVVLLRESQYAIAAVNNEMDNILLYFKKHLPKLDKEEKLMWWKRIKGLKD